MTKKFLVIAESRGSELKKSTQELLGLAQGQEVYGVLFGSSSAKAAETLAQMGVKEVFYCAEPSFDRYHSEAYASAVAELVEKIQPEVVLASATSLGKDLLPKLAARFDAHLVSDVIEAQVGDELRLRRPYFSGKASAEIRVPNSELVFLSLRPNALAAGRAGDQTGKITSFQPAFDFGSSKIQFLEQTKASSDRPDLAEASTIVSGGRSLKSRENFKILFDLADVLGAAVGASRAAVDEGLADHDMQVGQTGKTVNPNLYMAFGISGAIQHLAGMRTSKVIVAINKDAQAPIFSKADYGIVGDLFELAPLITEEAKKQL